MAKKKPVVQAQPLALLNDQPVGEGTPSSADGLGFSEYARVLAEVALQTPGPFTIGIFGDWGTGKTSLLRLTEEHLSEKKNVITVWFNAWRFEGEEQPIVPLVARIVGEIERNKDFLSRLADGGESLLRGLRAVAYGFSAKSKVKIPGFAEIEAAFVAKDMIDRSDNLTPDPLLNRSIFFEAFEQLSKARVPDDTRVVVLIDDLDRCFPDRAIRLLESIKLVLAQPGFIFFMGVARRVLEGYLQHRYAKDYGISGFEGQAYLDKIGQLPFHIPPHRNRMSTFWDSVCPLSDRTLGRVIGGLFGAGGRTRTYEMYQALKQNWKNGDHVIDIVGFSRGGALAVNFANVINEKGVRAADGNTIKPDIRFLGVWDVVGSFGIPIDIGKLHFQELNVGWNLTVPANVASCAHAMALDERRQTFEPTRLTEDGEPSKVEEIWFRGVHSDIGGGNENVGRSDIALTWMFQKASGAGVEVQSSAIEQARLQSDPDAPISENLDPIKNPRRVERDGDKYHPTTPPLELDIGDERTFTVYSARKSNWSRVRMKRGEHYCFEIPAGDTWKDASITCGPEGWKTEDLPLYKEVLAKLAEFRRRYPEADWFEMIGVVGDEEELFRIGTGGAGRTFTPSIDGEFAAFANDLVTAYGNNSGEIELTVRRVADPAEPIESRRS